PLTVIVAPAGALAGEKPSTRGVTWKVAALSTGDSPPSACSVELVAPSGTVVFTAVFVTEVTGAAVPPKSTDVVAARSTPVSVSGATRSGFLTATAGATGTIVGPRELYGSTPLQYAPTASAFGELAGSGMLPSALPYWSGLASPVTKRSNRASGATG